MANSSPPARVQQRDPRTAANRMSCPWGSNIELHLEELRLEDRNTEESHQRGLAQAKRDHEDLRKTAIEVLKHYHIQEEQRRIQIEQQQQEARLRAEAELAAERQRLEALRAKSVPIPPPPPPEPSAAEAPKPAAPAAPSASGNTPQSGTAPSSSATAPTDGAARGGPSAAAEPQKPTASPAAVNGSTQAPPAPTLASGSPIASGAPSAQPKAAPAPPTSEAPKAQVNGAVTAAPTAAPAPATQPVKPDRHVEIHKKLKQLRAFMEEQRKSNAQLKGKMGDMRREIRKSMGQLVEGPLSNNKQPLGKIAANLQEALRGGVPSQPVDPNEFLLEARGPVEGALNNQAQLPSLFIYLLNIFAKSVISQFINECGAKPQAADPVGTVVAKIFSDPEFLWRGGSMIDLLLAKLRVVCPVLFGFRGSDRTEQGRRRVGWWKAQGGGWIPEQMHVDRMTGLGAGFGAIALRDFSKSKSTNPFPPSRYWTALARIVSTPANEISDTQCYVLKAMIENYEQKFIHFYGNAAVAALRVALIEFPARAPTQSAAVKALPVYAQILKKNYGLDMK